MNPEASKRRFRDDESGVLKATKRKFDWGPAQNQASVLGASMGVCGYVSQENATAPSALPPPRTSVPAKGGGERESVLQTFPLFLS